MPYLFYFEFLFSDVRI